MEESPAADKHNIDLQTLRLFWSATLQNRRLLLLSSLQALSTILLTVLSPFFVGKIIGSFFTPGANHAHYLPYFITSGLLGALCNRIGFPSLMSLQAHTQSILQARCLDVLLRRGVSFHSNNVGGKLVSDAIDFPNAYGTLLLSGFGNLIPFALTLIVGSIVIIAHSWLLGLVIITMAVFTLGSSIYESRRRSGLRKQRLAANKAVTGHMADTILNVQTVKSFAQEDAEHHKHLQLSHVLRGMRLRDWASNSRQNNNRILILLGFQVAFIISLLYLVPRDPSLLAIGVFGFTFAITVSNRMIEITILLLNLEEALLQASPMTEVLLQDVEIKDAPDAKPLKVDSGAVELHNMSFRYTDANQDSKVFSNLNLIVKPGEKIGLVGPSGGGKSTLTRLLLRFEDINSGTISIDGQDIASVTQASLRGAIAYVPQEPLLFHRTVSENIAYGNQSATPEQIKHAAKLAYADEFIEQLPQGFDTIVGERGVKLSGGQRQRVAIARAILKDAPILILDEATSALDSESEVYIQQALWKLMEGRTTLVIAHRLSTIQHLDRIIVLEDGAITEQGSHKQLLKHKGTYAMLWGHQTGGFIDD